MPPSVVISPVIAPRTIGAPRPVRLPLSDSASANAIEMPAPSDAAIPTRNAFHDWPVAKAAANTGASVDTEPSISPARPGWITRSTNMPALHLVLFGAHVGRQVLLDQLAGNVLVRHLGLGKVAEQLADRGVFAARRRAAVETQCLEFHALGEVAHLVEPERTDLPDRRMLDEATNVVAPDQWDVLAELLLIKLDQAAAMIAFLAGHFGEDVGRGGVVLAQTLGDVGVDTAVLFLVGNGQREDLALGEIGEVTHGANIVGWPGRVK